MIQLVKPGPRLAKVCVKNRGLWEEALIIWIFSELIYIVTGTHNTSLAVKQIVVSRKALRCYLITFLSACVDGTQTTVISNHFRLSERVKRLETYSNQGTIAQSATPGLKQIVQKINPTNRAHYQKKALIPFKPVYRNLRYSYLLTLMTPGEMQVSLQIRK